MNCEENICTICYNDNESHSFYKINNIQKMNIPYILRTYNDILEFSTLSFYYTCPSKSKKYYDKDGIINHFENLLNFNNENKWIWIFDGNGFELKHSLQLQTAIAITKIISSKYKKSLKNIIIINSSWHLQNALNLLWVFLDDHLKSLIIIDNI